MKDRKESTVGGNLLGLYISRFQKEAFRRFDNPQERDYFWPFKFVWFVSATLWQMLFGKSKLRR